MAESKAPRNSLYYLKKIPRFFGKVVIGILALIVLIFILIQTPPVQNFARKKIESYLQNKLQTKVTIGKLYIGLPDIISLQNVYIEDKAKDTLLAGGKLKVNIDLFRLLNNVVEINDLQLEGVTAKIKRQLPDTTYNFQFIVDAFTPVAQKPVNTKDSSVMQVDISNILLNKVHVIYRDVVSGSNVDVVINHFNTKIDKFDPYKLIFSIPETQVDGVTAKIYQVKPLVSAVNAPSTDMVQAEQPVILDLQFKNLSLKNIDFDYKNDVSAFYSRVKFSQLIVDAEKVDLPHRVIQLNTLKLDDALTALRLGNNVESKQVVQQVKQNVNSQAQMDWQVNVGNLQLNKNTIQFDDDSKPKQSAGIDYSHILAKEVTLHANNIVYNKDSILLSIVQGSLKEKNGLQVNRMEGSILYAAKQAYLQNFVLETPGTSIKRNIVLDYPSIGSITKDLSSLRINIDLQNSRVQVKDLLVFAPQLKSQPAFRNPNAVWYLNGKVRGNVSNLQIDNLNASGLSRTKLDICGTVVGLMHPTKARGQLHIKEFTTSRSDVLVFVSPTMFPKNITLPDKVYMSGTVSGNMDDISPDLGINTSLGSVRVTGRVQHASNPSNLVYAIHIAAKNLDVGTIMQDTQRVGKITADVIANGSGIDPKTASAKFSGNVVSAQINRHTYQDLKFDGSLAQQAFVINADMRDPNATLALHANGNMGSQFPTIKFDATVDSIKTEPLHFSTGPVSYHGKITGDFTNADPDNLVGHMFITQSILTNYDQRFQVDTIALNAGTNANGKFLNLSGDGFSTALAGNYKLTEIGSIVQSAIQPYFAMMPEYKAAQVSPYNFTFSVRIIDKPLWKILMPGLTTMKTISIDGNFSNTAGWKLTAVTPSLVYKGTTFDHLQFTAGSNQSSIAFKASLDHLKNGQTMNVYGISLDGNVAKNQVDVALSVKDKASKDKYHLGLLVKQPTFGNYVFSLKAGDLLLNYDKWSVPADNAITFTSSDLHINNLVLAKGVQQLSVNSTSTAANSPIDVRFSQFKLGTFTGFLLADTLLVEGTLNGVAQLRNVMQQPAFTTDLTITDLSVRQDTIGNASIKVSNTVRDTYVADIAITGHGNDVRLKGEYHMAPQNASTYDLNLVIAQLQLHSIEGLTANSINSATGYLSGNIRFNGSLQQPNVNGELNFNRTRMLVTYLNSYFTVDQEKITVNNDGLRFDTFTIKDSVGNAIVIDGVATSNNFRNYQFNLNVTARNFRAINSTKKQNSLFYGSLYLNTNLHIGGTETAPSVDGTLRIDDKTDFTVVLPQEEPGVESRQGIVEFIDVDAPVSDSVLLKPYYCLNNCNVSGLDVSVNISINKNAVLSLIIDEGNGDFIRMKGEGQISAGVDRSGKITLTGTYTVNEGSYELSFNFIKRRFEIEKGSSLTWEGEPTSATLNVNAYYVANTAPLDLVDKQLSESSMAIRNTYRQKLPFQVYLHLQGELLTPVISFDVVLPEDQNYNVSRDIISTVESRLDELRQEPSELNKQAFSLLLLNRFMAENPFDNNSGGGLNAASFARQSVSKILTDQLNRIATDLIQGVDINFDVVSSDDYTTGERRDRTDFNVSLSKQLLSDRLTVKVGNDFQLEGPKPTGNKASALAGDVALDYRLSRDGSYVLRGYRKNVYQGVVEGYIIETGLSFIITVDYNRFADLLHRRRKIPPKHNDQPTQNSTGTPSSGDKVQAPTVKG
jgi:hypothetical protein